MKRLLIALLLVPSLAWAAGFSSERWGGSLRGPGFSPMQRGTTVEIGWSLSSPAFRENLVREMLTDSTHVGNLDYKVIDWSGTTGTVGGKQYTASFQPKLATLTGYITFDGTDDEIDLNSTSTVCLTWAFKFKRASTEVNYGSLAKGGTTTVEIYADGLDLGNNGISGYVCGFAANINDRYQTVVFSLDPDNDKVLAQSESGPRETSTPDLASTAVNFTDIALSVAGSRFKGEMVGVWAWSDVKTAEEVGKIYGAVSRYSPAGIFPNIGSSTITIASAAFRDGLNRELLTGNWTLNAGQLNVWNDSTGNGNSASQATAINQPTIVGSYAYFDGSNDYMDFNTLATSTTWALKFTRMNAAGDGGTIVTTWDTSILHHYTDKVQLYKSGTYANEGVAVNSVGATQTWIIVNDQANNRCIHVTNSGVTVTPFATAIPANAMNGKEVGKSGVGWYFKGLLWGAWSWNKALTITEAYQFQKALKENYNP